MSRARRKRFSSPARTIGWSSASTRSIDTSRSESRERQGDVEPRAGIGRIDGQPAGERVDPLAQHPRPPARRLENVIVIAPPERKARAIVGDVDVNLGVLEADLHANDGGAG